MKPTVAIGMLAVRMDGVGRRKDRWRVWRPTIGLCMQDDLALDRLELLHQSQFRTLAERVAEDVRLVSPETEVCLHPIKVNDPWDFSDVYSALYAFARSYSFNEETDYLIHITPGTHTAQICLFLLTESRHLPGRLVQTSPSKEDRSAPAGEMAIIDLDLSRYDQLASRFEAERRADLSFLKAGIETCDQAFNQLIEEIETVALRSVDPILLTGPTGVGKTHLARRIYELRKRERAVQGPLVEVNCGTLRGDQAASALFGHVKGAFTGALTARAGHLLAADGGVLFLDEVGELGLDEQTMLLRAIEEKEFFPVGSDHPVESDFQLICGTNRDLVSEVRSGHFREDLLARIDLWSFRLPALTERLRDLAPNLDYELKNFERRTGRRITFTKEARQQFLNFATAPETPWSANFRDLNAAVTRMATLCPSGRITAPIVEAEVARLERHWHRPDTMHGTGTIELVLGKEQTEQLDLFDRAQLANVLEVCRTSRSLSDAGRKLFAVSRKRRKSANDADRLSKYLGRFGLQWADVAD